MGRDLTIHYAHAPRPVLSNALRRDVLCFAGRTAELERIVAAAELGTPAIHTIDGMPGVGKTALATRAMHRLAAEFPDGRFFVELHAHTPGQQPADPAAVLAKLLTDLGVDPRFLPATVAQRRDWWLDRIAGKRILLVLDDARDHAQVEPLLPASDGCLTLITSRRRLAALDGAVALPLDVPDAATAAELFCALAHRDPDAAERAAADEIVRRCAALPLAIVLLAGRLAQHPGWSIARLSADFAAAQDRLGELAAGPRAVRAAFTMSYRCLSPERQRLFRYLGLHPGPDVDAAALAAMARIPATAARTELEGLYLEHLVEETSPARFRLHDLLREYAHGLAAADDHENDCAAMARLLGYYHATAAAAHDRLARHTEPTAHPIADPPAPVREFSDEAQALTWLRTESACLQAVLDDATAEDTPSVLALTQMLARLFELDGTLPAAATHYDRAYTAARRRADRLGEAVALDGLGRVRALTGAHTEAGELHRKALARYRCVGDLRGEGNARNGLGVVHRVTGNLTAAEEQFQRALACYREIADLRGQARALGNLSIVRRFRGDFGAAVGLLRQALACYREADSGRGQAGVLDALGALGIETGNFTEAIGLLQQALAQRQALGDRLGTANTRTNLGVVCRCVGNYAAADAHLRSALVCYRELGTRLGEANALDELGRVRKALGAYADAAALHERALAHYRAIGNRVGAGNALIGLGVVRRATGAHSEATDLLDQALTLFRALGVRNGEAEALNEIGALLLETGKPERGLAAFRAAFELARTIHSAPEQADALAGSARCRIALGELGTARAELGAAVEIYRRGGAAAADSAAARLAAMTDDGPELTR